MLKIKTVPSSERSEVSLLSDINTTQSGFPLPGYNGAMTLASWVGVGVFSQYLLNLGCQGLLAGHLIH